MLPRYLAISAGLLLLLLVERFTFYGVRSTLLLFFIEDPLRGGLGLDAQESREVYRRVTLLLGFTPLLGGLVALFTGPRVLLVLGAVLTACGYAALGAASTVGLILPFALMTVGNGLFRPAFYAVAAGELPSPHENGRNALFVALYAILNLGAMLAPMVSAGLSSSLGFTVAFASMAVLTLGGGLLAGGVGLLQRLMRQPPATPPGGHWGLGVGVLFLLGLPFMLALPQAGQVHSQALGSVDPSSLRFFSILNPLTVLVLSVLLVGGLLACAQLQRPVPTLLPLGVGLLLFTLSVVQLAMLVLEVLDNPWPVLISSSVVGAAGEVLVFSLLLSRVLADTPRRLAPLIAGAWLCLSSLTGQASLPAQFSGTPLVRGLLVLVLVGCAAAAVGAFFLWKRVARWFTPPASSTPG